MSLPCLGHNGGLQYLENKGQWEEQVLFKARLGTGAVFIESDGFTFFMRSADDLRAIHDNLHKGVDTQVNCHAWKLHFMDTSGPEEILTTQKSNDYYNYFIGQDSSKWKSQVHAFGEVLYKNIWPGIDLKVYSTRHPKGNNFKYDFVVHPGADASLIQFEYLGLDGVVLENQELELLTSLGTFTEAKPLCYQENNKLVRARYQVLDEVFSYAIEDSYDTKKTLIIDPELIAATYVGATVDDALGSCSTYNAAGEIIGGSSPYNSTVFPTTLGAFSVMYNGGSLDIGITKFNADGTDLIWSTYLGGDSLDRPISMIANSMGDTYLLAMSKSSNFPVTQNALRDTIDGIRSNVVVRLSNDGTNLIASTYLASMTSWVGFNVSDFSSTTIERGEIILDENERPVIATHTNSETFPVSENGYQTELNGDMDAAVVCLAPNLSSVVWGTYVGGEGREYFLSLRINQAGNIILVGVESSLCPWCNDHFPTTIGAYQEIGLGHSEGVVSVLSPDASDLLYSTYFSTSEPDSPFYVELDSEDHIWVCGMTQGEAPLVGSAYSNAPSPTYIAKFSPDLSTLELCSQIGAGLGVEEFVMPTAFMIDYCDRIYLSGCAEINNTYNLIPLTDDALFNTGGFYLAQYSPNMGELLYSTLFGGEHINGGHSRFDKKGIVYQSVCSSFYSPNVFQALPNAWAPQQGDGADFELGVFKIDFQSDATVSQFGYEIQGNCAPVLVNLTNYSSVGNYTWLVDGTEASNDTNPQILIEEEGYHQIELIVHNDATCNIADTLAITVNVPPSSNLQTSWEISPVDYCADTLVISASYTGSNEEGILWQFDEGTSNQENIQLVYSDNGEYSLQLVTYDEECQISDTLSTVFPYDPLSTSWSVSASDPCGDSLVVMGDFTGIGQESLQWIYDNQNIDSENIALTFYEQGIYDISLIAFDENCQTSDTLSTTFEFQGTIQASTNVNTSQGCQPLELVLNGESNLGTGYWQTPWGSIPESFTQVTLDEVGIYNLWFVVQNDESCNGSDSVEVSIEVFPSLHVEMEVLTQEKLCDSEQLVQLVFTGNNADYLTWDMGDGSILSGSIVEYTYNSPGVFTIVLTAENHLCQQQEILAETIEVQIITPEFSSIIFPNVISPNNDGNNDRLLFSTDDNPFQNTFDIFELSIFNQWGTFLFKSSNPENAWDGRYKGETVPEGTYFFILKYQRNCLDQEVQIHKGSIGVLR